MKNIPLSDIHYKNTKLLQRYLTPSGNIVPRSKSGFSAKQQRRLSREIKRARHLALLPFVTTL
jgi:small subunit ribosomal protein S18